ncbi:MAG: tetraacyldisaccharide 4'-kinase [Burkholderiales bacterium]
MWLEQHWQRITPVSVLLYPLSLVFRAVIALRRAAYATGILKRERVAAPVIVVGNISVGGTGKTPMVLWLARFLSKHGRTPGIVSRGHGSALREPHPVSADANADRFGDEPVLLARRSGCPVWIGHNRAAAARALLESHPACDTILSDDGLQHYGLHRDLEVVVIDGARGLGNGCMLPAGPLREPASRLRSVDAVVINGPPRAVRSGGKAFAMRLEGTEFRNLLNPEHLVDAGHFRNQRIHAVAGIGHPARFFSHLRDLGIEFEGHAFEDHHAFTPSDIDFPDADAVLMTEKDAVKCATFASEKHWVLPVDADPDAALGALVLRTLQEKSP